jgi:hypothetical protein
LYFSRRVTGLKRPQSLRPAAAQQTDYFIAPMFGGTIAPERTERPTLIRDKHVSHFPILYADRPARLSIPY